MTKSDRIRFKAVLNRVPDDTEQILDIGCTRHQKESREKGNLHDRLITNTDASVVGIDILENEVRSMQEAGYDVRLANAETFDFESDFDVIVAGELIEHLDNPGKFLSNASDHLTDTGRLIVTTPNPDAFSYFRKALLNQSNNLTHTCWIDPFNLRQLTSRTELVISEWEYLPPVGGISTILWKFRFQRASGPGYVATLTKEHDQN